MDISSMLEVQVKEETDVKENVTPGRDQASSATGPTPIPISQEENNYYKLMFGNETATVRFRRLHCTACDTHIGSAPSQAHNMLEHPVLRTLLCAHCREFYGDGSFEQGDDNTDMFCRWCANGGNLYCCSYCSNTFCYKCIRRNFTSLVRKKIEADEKWKCFVCNPSGLYSARAVCWALLQHIQTVRRILAHDKKMNSVEIEEKMNFDESLCCPHRNKRKRRRIDSDSEEEDETYLPEVNGTPGYNIVKRKTVKRTITTNRPTTNGIAQPYANRIPIPIRPRPMTFLNDQSFQAEPSQPAVSHKNAVRSSSEGIVLSSSSVVKSNTSLPSRFDTNKLMKQQSSLYRTSFMKASGSTTYIQPTRIILPPPPLQSQPQPQSQSQPQPQPQPQPQLQPQPQSQTKTKTKIKSFQPQQTSSYQPSQSLQSTPNTMVSIPNLVDKHNKPLFILPKVNMTLTPNIIELDSDSDDEPRIVTQQDNSVIDNNSNVGISKVVPVALTWENSDDDAIKEDQPLMEIHATSEEDASFNKIMSPHCQELNKLLSDTKKKVSTFFDTNTVENVEVETKQAVKNFYYNMRNTVFKLVNINDRVIRQYIEWRRSQKTQTETSPSVGKNSSASEEKDEEMTIPLDMICVADSETESEYEDQENRIIGPSALVKDSNIIKDLLFNKKTFVHCGVGDGSAHSVDKAIQVFDIVSRDYESVIGHSVITKADTKTDDSASDPPVTSDKNFGKYEEQFIFYLQHIEDNGIETEEMKSLADFDETLLQEMSQTDASLISQLFDNIDLSIPIDQSENFQQEENMSDSINTVTKNGENDIMDTSDKEIVNNSDEIIPIEIQETNPMQPDEELQQTKSPKTHADMTDEEAIISDNNEANSNKMIV